MGSSASKSPSGFRICKIAPGSPGDHASLEVFFDYIVEVGAVAVESREQSFSDLVKEFEGKQLKLTVYNCRTHALRDVTVIPHVWEGQGLLGITVKYGHILESENQGVRILEVKQGSPADIAGLVPFRDYPLVSGDIIIRDSDDFAQLLSTHANELLPLIVYNSDTETLREISLLPKNGLIGCGLGTGVLHQIPLASKYAQESNGLKAPNPSERASVVSMVPPNSASSFVATPSHVEQVAPKLSVEPSIAPMLIPAAPMLVESPNVVAPNVPNVLPPVLPNALPPVLPPVLPNALAETPQSPLKDIQW